MFYTPYDSLFDSYYVKSFLKAFSNPRLNKKSEYDALNYELEEIEGGIKVLIDLPGVKKENVQLDYNVKNVFDDVFSTQENVLEVIWEKDNKKYSEKYSFRREYDLNTTKAKLEDGVLTLTVLKKTDDKYKKHKVLIE